MLIVLPLPLMHEAGLRRLDRCPTAGDAGGSEGKSQ